jgi:release factor glutamine methyltransferase
MPEPATLDRAFLSAARSLREAGMETPELDARLLLCHAAGLSHEAYIARSGDTLRPEAAARLEQALARRLTHEPVSRILGTREFYGRAFSLGPETLDPRADTETLIEAALADIEARGGRDEPLKLLDLGTGTGCILLTLLAELPQARGLGTDLSQAALALAAANAVRLGLFPRASFIAADWLDFIDGTFDLIVSNPPYLASGEIEGLAAGVSAYDPRLALDGGLDGLDAYRRVAAGARARLAENGRLMVEIGAGQVEAVREIFADSGLEILRLCHDLGDRPRVIVAGP